MKGVSRFVLVMCKPPHFAVMDNEAEAAALRGADIHVRNGNESTLLLAGRHPFFARGVRFGGFALCIEYRYEKNNSNINFFSYDNHPGNARTARRF